MADVVLDRIQLFLRAARADFVERREGPAERIFVTPDGRIRVADAVPDDDRPGLAEVRRNVFA